MKLELDYTIDAAEQKSTFSSVFKFFVWISIPLLIIGYFGGFVYSVSIITIVCLLGVVIGLKNPILGFFSICILISLDPVIRSYILLGGLFRWNTINYWFILFTILNAQVLLRNLSSHLIAIIALMSIMLLQLIYSPDKENGVMAILGVFSCIALYTYMLSIRRYELKSVLYYGALITAIMSILTGMLFFNQYGLDAFNLRKLLSEGVNVKDLDILNANAFATMFISSIIISTVAYNFLDERKHKLNLLIGMIVCIGFILLTGSRGALLTGLVSIYFAVSKRANIIAILFWGISGFFILSLISPTLENSESVIGQKIYVFFKDDATAAKKTNGRSDLAIVGLNMFIENPLGVGTGGFAESFADYTKYEFSDIQFNQTKKQSHSGLIKLITENGILGIIFFIIFLGRYYYRKKNRNYKNGIYFIFIIITTLLSSEYQSKPIWFLGAIVAYLSLIDYKQVDTHILE